MGPSTHAAMRRSLVRLRERGESVGLVELAQRLLAADSPVDPALARRVVGAALGRSPASLPDRLGGRDLRFDGEYDVADQPLRRAEFVVVDLETTGLGPQASILEIGAVRVEGLKPSSRFETLVRPPGRVPPAIVALTGIHDEMVADAPIARRALRDFRRWLDATPCAPFVAHNASFDHGFTSRAFDGCGQPDYRGPVLCTRKLGRRLVPQLGRYNLDHLCAHFGVANRARHRAMGDAEATAHVLIDLVHLALEKFELSCVGDLIDLERRPPARRRRKKRPRKPARRKSV